MLLGVVVDWHGSRGWGPVGDWQDLLRPVGHQPLPRQIVSVVLVQRAFSFGPVTNQLSVHFLIPGVRLCLLAMIPYSWYSGLATHSRLWSWIHIQGSYETGSSLVCRGLASHSACLSFPWQHPLTSYPSRC